jgi:hypothetical protein
VRDEADTDGAARTGGVVDVGKEATVGTGVLPGDGLGVGGSDMEGTAVV